VLASDKPTVTADHENIYIVGTGPTVNTFPMNFFEDKICLSLNDAYKIHPAITPIALMHHEIYAHVSKDPLAPYHSYFDKIRYPIIKGSSRKKTETVDWDNPYYYYYDWSLDIEDIWTMTKETDYLYYTPEGCSLQAANIFVIGCDSRLIGGKHYADYNKDGIREDQPESKMKGERNYDSYVYGILIAQEFLKRKGVNVFYQSSIIGYHMIDYQMDFLRGEVPLETIYAKTKELRKKINL